jgi:hypothetical protein
MSLILALAGALATSAGLHEFLVAPVCIALAITVLQLFGRSLPQSRWQVPEYWRRTLDSSILPFAYGAILGLGIFTAVVVGAFWVFLAVTLRYTAPVALLGWSAYALGRMAGFRLALRVRPPERLLLTTFQRRTLLVVTAMVAVLATVA